MTLDEQINYINIMLGENVDSGTIMVYLKLANQKILNHRFPFGTNLVEVEQKYEMDMLELAIVLYNQRGGEGQTVHSENGVRREWRTEHQILKGIPRMVGIPK